MCRGEPRSTFWVERSAQRLGFDRLSARVLGDERWAPYLFVGAALFLDVPVLNSVNYVRGYRGTMGSMWWEWPGVIWWLIPAIVIGALFLLRSLRARYYRAADVTGEDAAPAFDPTLSRRLQVGTLLVGSVVFLVWLSTSLGFIFARTGPVVGSVKWFVIVPLVYNPLATDLAAAYVHVQLVLPHRIRRAGVPLDFSDPRRLGGLYSVGRTMRFAAMSMFVALTLYTALWYAGLATGLETALPAWTRLTVIAFFTLAWTLATATLLSGLYLMHRYMRAARRDRLEHIHETIRGLGDDDETVPDTAPGSDAEFRAYVREYVNLDRVERTRTVPLNVAVAWELLGAALLPVALQLLVNVV